MGDRSSQDTVAPREMKEGGDRNGREGDRRIRNEIKGGGKEGGRKGAAVCVCPSVCANQSYLDTPCLPAECLTD